MIGFILFFVICVTYNEAHNYFKDDLDYAGVGGRFIPIENLDIQESDALSARSTEKNLIPDLLQAIQNFKIQNGKSKEVQLNNECTLKIEEKEKHCFEITAGEDCGGTVNIGKVISRFFENFDIDALSSEFIQSNNLLFQSMMLNKTYVKIKAKYHGIYTHTQSMLRLTNIDLELGIPINQQKKSSETSSGSQSASSTTSKNGANQSFSFEMKCKFSNLDTEIFYNVAESPIVKISITLEKTTVKEFLKFWSLGFTELKESGLSTETFENAEFSGHVTGQYNTSNNHFQLFAQFKYQQKPFDLTVNLILDKPKGLPIVFALVIQLNNVDQIFDYLKTLVGYDGPDFVKDLVKSCILSVSNSTIDLIDSDGFLKLAGNDQKSVLPGINIFIETNVRKVLHECDNTIEPGTKEELVNITLTKAGFVIKLPVGFSADLSIVMKCLLQKTTQQAFNKALQIPKLLAEKNRDPSFLIKELSFENDVFKISISYSGDIVIPFLNVSISNPTFTVSKKKSKDEPWIFKGQAYINASFKDATTNKVKIDFTFDTDQNINVSINVPALDVKSLANLFGISSFKEDIKNLEIIKDLYIEGKLNKNNGTGEFTVTGSPVINGITGLTFAAFIWKPQNQPLKLAFGLVMDNIRLDHALQNFTGVEMPYSWLRDVSIKMLASTGNKDCSGESSNRPECLESTNNTEKQPGNNKQLKNSKSSIKKPSHVNDGVIKKSTSKNVSTEPKVISKDKDKTTHFKTIHELRKFDIKEGLALEASFKPKAQHCGDNSICNFLVKKKITELFLKGNINSTDVNIKAGIYGEINLFDKVTLKNATLELNFGSKEKKVSITCEFHITETSLVITGSIEFLLKGMIKIKGTMKGMVQNPFKIEWLSIGNLTLSFGIDFSAASLTIEMGASIVLGYETDTNNSLKFQGYIGFDVLSPAKIFFYARSFGGDLTVDNILKVFKKNYSLPDMVKESGFIGETIVSWNHNLEEIKIDELDLAIPPGLMLKGKISILTYKIECEFKIDLEKKTFFFNANFDPIDDWGSGMIKLYRSADNHTEGPVLYLDIQHDKFEVCIKGYINILGVGSLINIEITSSLFSFEVSGNLWGVLTMSVKVKAEYANKKLDSFSFDGCLTIGIILRVLNASLQFINETAQKANEVLKRVETALENAEKHVAAVNATIMRWENETKLYKKRLEERKQKLEAEMNQSKARCENECGIVCVPFFGWVDKCTTIWGHPVGCMKWDNCKWKAPNLVCIAACEITRGLAKFAAWAEQIGIKIMLGLTAVGEFFLKAATELTDIGKYIIDKAKEVVKFAKNIVDEISKFAESLFNITELCLYAKFSSESKTCVGYNLTGTFFRGPFSIKGSICIDLSIYKTLGSSAAKSAEPKIKELEDNTASIDAKVKDVDRACKQMEKNASRLENEVKSTTTAKLEKRSHVYTEEELRFHKLVYDPLPDVNLRSEETNIAMTHAVPWESLNVEEFGKSTKDAAFTRHQIPNEESHDACHQHQNVLSRYSTIANGFSSAVERLNDAKEGFMYQKRLYLNQIDYLNGLIRSGPLNNMTSDEQEDLWHWKDYAEDHIKSYLDKATSVFQGKKRDSINHVRQALNDVIESDRGLKLPEYIKYLHSLAVKADKKSQVNQKPTKDSTSSWHHIKKILVNVATDDNIPTFELAKEIGKVQKMLSAMKRSSILCAA